MSKASLIQPGSAEWLRYMSPSKAAAVYGVSRWESARSLWHRMRGELPADDPKDIFKVGHAWEPALRELWKLDNPGWRLSAGEVQVDAGDRFGFPLLATIDGRASKGRARKVVEKKTARKLEDWGDDFTEDGAPMDYVVQVWIQQLVTGWTKEPADLTVMGPYFRHHTYRIAFDADVATDIVDELGKFYRRLKDPAAAPELDDHVATYECVRKLHPDIDGTRVTVDGDLGRDYLGAVLDLRDAETRLRGLKTRILDAAGPAKYVDVETDRVDDDGDPVLANIAYRKPGRGGSVALTPISEKAMEAIA